MEVGLIIGLLVVVIIGFALITSSSSQPDSLTSAPLFYGGVVAILAGGFALYRVITA